MGLETESRRRFRARAVRVAALAIAACAGTPPPRPTTPVHTANVPSYTVEPSPGAILGVSDSTGIAEAIERAGRDAGRVLTGDGRLAGLARRFATTDAVTPPALEPSARESGLVDVDLVVVGAQAARAEQLPAAIEAALAGPLRTRAPTHFGLYVAEDGTHARLVLGRRPPGLERVPRALACCGGIRFAGRLSARDKNPELIVAGPNGVTLYPAGTGPSFELNVPTPEEGAYRLELRARSLDETRSFAALSVRVGRVSAPRSETQLGSAFALREELYRRCASARAEHGLAPLTIDAEFEARAAQRSRRLVESEGSTALATSASEWRSIARGADVDRLLSALLGDAAFRSQLLSPEMLHIGIGVSRGEAGYVAAVTLARDAAQRLLDPGLAGARVLGALNENRRVRGGGALRPDPALTHIAERAVRELAKHPVRRDPGLIEQPSLESDRLGLGYARIAAVGALVSDPLDAAALEPALDADASAVGIALADVATADQTSQLAVVIALGWER